MNAMHPDPELSLRNFEMGETHHHSCLDHLGPNGEVRAGDVHLARPIVPDPQDLNGALACVCGILNIENGSVLPEPGKQGLLL
jgi:hypothetical protein